MIGAVLDANVLISGLISAKGIPGRILDGWLAGRFRLCLSQPILDELTRDPSDNIYLASAVEASCDFLVTGNCDHFEETGRKYRGVEIISPPNSWK